MLEPEDRSTDPVSDDGRALPSDVRPPDSSDLERVVPDDPHKEQALHPEDDLATEAAITWATDPPSSLGGGASW